MTDIEKLKVLFDEFGIGYSTGKCPSNSLWHTALSCEEGHNKIDGYNGFFTDFAFDKNGKFIEMGAWE